MGPGRAVTPRAAAAVDARRRRLVAGSGLGVAVGLGGTVAACRKADAEPPRDIPVEWVGAPAARGHRLRQQSPLPPIAVQRRAGALVLGAGIAGLSAARGFVRAGVEDVHVLELDDVAGGTSRGHTLAGMPCPLGAHYLPLPGPQAREVSEWLHEIGLLHQELGRTVADERHLCHSPQERLFVDGAWGEGLLPPLGAEGLRQARHFASRVRSLQGGGAEAASAAAGHTVPAFALPAYALPAFRSRWSATHESLNRETFATWLAREGIADPRLRWYLDYCCRDDYGADATTVSAWAGIHYFASRHGFAAPGEEAAERDAVFTWPQGNAWLADKLAAPLGERLHTGRTVLRVVESRHAVQALVFDEAQARVEAWTAPQAVLALPLFVAARVLDGAAPQTQSALREAAAMQPRAPWLVANLHVREPLLQAQGAPPAWDNVVFGTKSLGYVDASHQSLRTAPGPTVITAYHPLDRAERAGLLAAQVAGLSSGPSYGPSYGNSATWHQRVLEDLRRVHPDIERRVERIALGAWGHAMAVPALGVHRHPALQALRAAKGRIRFAHADLAGYSVFEEAFTAGSAASAPEHARWR
jgi:monoamine oxidase